MIIDLSNLNSTTSSMMSQLPITLSVSHLTVLMMILRHFFALQDSNGTSQSGSGLQSSDDLRDDREQQEYFGLCEVQVNFFTAMASTNIPVS